MKGDAITDTHATNMSVAYSDLDCSMLNNPGDCTENNTPFIPHTKDNYMFASNITNPCIPSFTPKQGERMIEKIEQNPLNRFTDASTTLESLFEPFDVKDITGDVIISVTPIDFETAEVCRNILRLHRFQPGFNYTFTNTYAPDPSFAGIDDLPEIKHNTYLFGVTINQINPNCEIIIPVICTRGQICEIEPYVGGKLFTSENLGSTNYSYYELTETELNNPNFIEQLENNKYHLIKKETESGAMYQVTIYKN